MLYAAQRFHPDNEINLMVTSYAWSGFHPWPCVPRGKERPISSWPIAEFLEFMAEEHGHDIAKKIKIALH